MVISKLRYRFNMILIIITTVYFFLLDNFIPKLIWKNNKGIPKRRERRNKSFQFQI